MNGNILKPSMYVLFSIAVIVVFILLFRQCSGDISTKETLKRSSFTEANIKKDSLDKGNKNVLKGKIQIVQSQNKGNSVQSLGDEPKLNSKERKKAIASSLVMSENSSFHKESQANMPSQFYESIEENKPKSEAILKNDIEKLTEKVNTLEEKVKALLEKMSLFSEEKKNRMLAEDLAKKERERKLASTMDTLKNDDDLIYKDPTHVLTGGLSTYEKWTGYGFQASYAYRINKFVSLGAQGNAFLKEGKYNGDRDFVMSFRANFHILPFFVENSKFDIYASGTAGIGRDDSLETFETMWYLGSSYDFNKHWGVFVEGGEIGVMGLRLTF